MATHKSAVKRARQAEKRRVRNRAFKSRVRTLVKDFRNALSSGDTEDARVKLQAAEGALRKAATKGAIPKAQVSRRVSRLAKSFAHSDDVR